MKAILSILSLLLLCCNSVFSKNVDNAILSNTVKRVSLDLASIHNEVRTYLESGKAPADTNEDVVVLVRQIPVEFLGNANNHPQRKKDPFFSDLLNTNEVNQIAEIQKALVDNDTMALTRFSEKILKDKCKRILDEATSLMIDLANGKKTLCSRKVTVTTTNGKTVKKEEVLYTEIERLNQLRDDYCKVITQMKKITANQGMDLTR